MAFVNPDEMTQDWGTPFTPEVIDSVSDFCVYCCDEECAQALWNLLMQHKEYGRCVSPTFTEHNWWVQKWPCYRFEGGVAMKHDSVRTYECEEIGWSALPKYTFYAGCADLPDIEMPEDIGLLVYQELLEVSKHDKKPE